MDADEAAYLTQIEAQVTRLRAALDEALSLARTGYLDEDDIHRLNELETLIDDGTHP